MTMKKEQDEAAPLGGESGEITFMDNKSDFGKGCIYNLALFIAHEAKWHQDLKAYEGFGGKNRAAEMWFHGAGDHMFEFLPDWLPESLRERGDNLKEFILIRRDVMQSNACEPEDVTWSLNEAKAILLEVDKLNGVPAVEANWK